MEFPTDPEDLPSRINVVEMSISENLDKVGKKKRETSGDGSTRSLRKLSAGKRRNTTNSDLETLDDEFSAVSGEDFWPN